MQMNSYYFFQLGTLCFISMAVADLATSPFLPNVPGQQWVKVGYLNMSDPTQQCPDSWKTVTSPRSSCEKKSSALCDSVNIPTNGSSYQKVCGRFRGYQVGTPDAFASFARLGWSLETYYVDGVSITYGSPGNRTHVYTYAAGISELTDNRCPCAGGASPPAFIGSDYYCESGNPTDTDVLWDGKQCGGLEVTCCNPPNLPWFCKTFPTPISEDLEVRLCLDQGSGDENVALEFFELYIQVAVPFTGIQTVYVFNVNHTLRHLEITWTPVGGNVTMYTVRVVGDGTSVSQGCTVCTTSPCFYVQQVPAIATNTTILVASISGGGVSGSQYSTTIYGPINPIVQNASFLSYYNSITTIGCSFLNNQSLYCVVCCSTDPSVPPDSSVYNISTSRGTEVTVDLDGLTSGQMYYCKAAATNTTSANCSGPVVGGVKVFFSFMTHSVSMSSASATCYQSSADIPIVAGIALFIVFVSFTLGVLMILCICKMRSKVTPHPPPVPDTRYETVNFDQKNKSFVLEDNSTYETVICE